MVTDIHNMSLGVCNNVYMNIFNYRSHLELMTHFIQTAVIKMFDPSMECWYEESWQYCVNPEQNQTIIVEALNDFIFLEVSFLCDAAQIDCHKIRQRLQPVIPFIHLKTAVRGNKQFSFDFWQLPFSLTIFDGIRDFSVTCYWWRNHIDLLVPLFWHDMGH